MADRNGSLRVVRTTTSGQVQGIACLPVISEPDGCQHRETAAWTCVRQTAAGVSTPPRDDGLYGSTVGRGPATDSCVAERGAAWDQRGRSERRTNRRRRVPARKMRQTARHAARTWAPCSRGAMRKRSSDWMSEQRNEGSQFDQVDLTTSGWRGLPLSGGVAATTVADRKVCVVMRSLETRESGQGEPPYSTTSNGMTRSGLGPQCLGDCLRPPFRHSGARLGAPEAGLSSPLSAPKEEDSKAASLMVAARYATTKTSGMRGTLIRRFTL